MVHVVTHAQESTLSEMGPRAWYAWQLSYSGYGREFPGIAYSYTSRGQPVTVLDHRKSIGKTKPLYTPEPYGMRGAWS